MTDWQEEIRRVADDYYDDGHIFEKLANEMSNTELRNVLYVKADLCRQIYGDLCALINKANPQPGAPEDIAKIW